MGQHVLPPAVNEAPKNPRAGFNGVLTRQQWKDVVDFAKAAQAEIVTSFATSPATRDGRIAAMGGAPAGYSAADSGATSSCSARSRNSPSPTW